MSVRPQLVGRAAPRLPQERLHDHRIVRVGQRVPAGQRAHACRSRDSMVTCGLQQLFGVLVLPRSFPARAAVYGGLS